MRKKEELMTIGFMKKFLIATAVIFVAVVAIGIMKQESQPKPAAKFETTVQRIYAWEPETAGVTFTIKNTGNLQKQPSCKVEVSSDENLKSGVYYGQGTFTIDETLEPSQELTHAVKVRVNKDGSDRIAFAKVTCN